MEMISQWSKRMNLVSYSDQKRIYENHFIPSFWFFETIKKENPKTVLDIGSGAGFPGMILKIINPVWDIYLVESNRKKSLFLLEVAEQLNLNPKVVNERIEKFIPEKNKTFDVILSRAVTSLKTLQSWSNVLLKRGGAIFTIKGLNYKNEVDYEEDDRFEYHEINPTIKWINISPNLKNKIIIKMKKI